MARRPTAEILTIGDELLKGSTLNTNAQFLGEQLCRIGFQVSGHQSCADTLASIQRALGAALAESDVVILTGGLGPTPDDLTRESVAGFFNVPLEFSKRQFSQILKYFKKRGRRVPAEWRKEAQFPSNAVQLVNRYGVALGFYIRTGRKLIVVLPGVPREMRKMFLNQVEPLLRRSFASVTRKHNLTVRFTGLGETQVMSRLGRRFVDGSFDFGIYPALGEVTMRLQADTAVQIRTLRRRIEKRLSKYIFAWEEISMARVIGSLLLKGKAVLAVAESCSGGQLSAEFTRVSGASAFFKGGVTAYSNTVKTELLGVEASVIKKHGAVSAETAKQMVRGVREKLGSGYALSITGIAGPDGGTRQKPVGTVFIGICGPRGRASAREFHFSGERSQIQRKSVVKAMEMLWRELLKDTAR